MNEDLTKKQHIPDIINPNSMEVYMRKDQSMVDSTASKPPEFIESIQKFEVKFNAELSLMSGERFLEVTLGWGENGKDKERSIAAAKKEAETIFKTEQIPSSGTGNKFLVPLSGLSKDDKTALVAYVKEQERSRNNGLGGQ